MFPTVPRPARFRITVPLETEVLRLHSDLATGAGQMDQHVGLVVGLDVRRRDWTQQLGLERGVKVGWENVRTVDVQDLSCFLMPIRYRVTFGDGYWWDQDGEKRYFGVDEHLPGLDLRRGVTTVTLRAAVLLAVLACVGVRSVSWLLGQLFHVQVSKSSLARWIGEVASQLPDAEGMVKRLQEDRPITEANLDEIFPRGWRKGCVLVVRDEHGRLVATEEVAERSAAVVAAFLRKLKSWGLEFRKFYVDGCKAYREAIAEVYPEAAIQYDYFHILQNIWRHVRKAMVAHRKEIKRQGEEAAEPEKKERLLALAKALWEHRGLLFKSDLRMTEQEYLKLQELISADARAGVVRGFLDRVWGIFRHSKDEEDARKRLREIQGRPEVTPKSALAKAVGFLVDRFDDMIAFLRLPGLRRNSLAETGMRCLRRLEQGHDGFRGPTGRDNYLRLYQAIRYCGWSVYRTDGLFTLPQARAPTPAAAAA